VRGQLARTIAAAQVPTRFQSIVAVGLLTGATLLLYSLRLASAPPILPEETRLLRDAERLATTGRDAGGRLLPLFVQSDAETWRQPVPVYAAATAAALLPGRPWAVRVPSLIAASTSVALMYVAALALFRARWSAIGAALLLMMTPAHVVYGRVGSEAVFGLPFALVWLAGLFAYLSRPRAWPLVLATVSLGLGAYANQSAPLTMAGLWACTAAALWLEGTKGWRSFLLAAVGFGAPLVGMAVWFLAHPETYPDTMGRWAIHAAHLRNPIDLWRATINRNTLGLRLSLFWDFYNPATLFFARDVPGFEFTRAAAPLPAAFVVLIPLGIWTMWTDVRRAWSAVLLGAFLVAPLAAAAFGEPYATDRALVAMLAAALLAMGGATALLAGSRRWSRTVGAALLAAIAAQVLLFALASRHLTP
jgi:4-amino-4-deoxy-L-arabinose transferase-like glycosyltransferase